MIFKELFDKVEKLKILKTMLDVYPDQENNLVAYDKMFDKLVKMEAEEDPDIVLTVFPQEDYFCGQMVDTVSGFSIENQMTYAIDFTEWKNWLGMTVCEKSLKHYGVEVFMVHCLYEMSFVSFDEEEIQNEISILKEREKEIEEGTAVFISMEEMCERFGIEPLPKKTEEEEAEDKKKMQANLDKNLEIKKEFLADFWVEKTKTETE